MMRLAKLAKQPNAVGNMLQEKLGTTKYQIQVSGRITTKYR